MKISLYIVNETDRPCEELLAYEGVDGLLYYAHPKLRRDPHYGGMSGERRVSAQTFGLELQLMDGVLYGHKVRDSTAVYADGRPRVWQGTRHFSFPYPYAKPGPSRQVEVYARFKLVLDIDEGTLPEDVMNELESSFEDTTGGARIVDSGMLDFDIED